jgi:quinol monooxygenase YgiN
MQKHTTRSIPIFIVTVDFVIAPGCEADFMPVMATQARNSLANEPACRQFDICVDAGDPSKILLYEVYDDRAAFDAHLASDHFKTFAAISEPLLVSRELRFFERVEA